MARVFLGLPDLRPDYVQAARDLGAPIMVSASALSKRWTDEMRDRDDPHPGFRPPPLGRLDGMTVALDSMGFTAMRLWGGYAVGIDQYADLGACHPWHFWASQDLCCEPEIAADEEEVVARIMETGWRYDALCDAADERCAPRPMKVLQGWSWHHYVICAEALEVREADGLIGIGSICRRQRSGPDGVLAIIDRLDKELPPNVLYHLFGVTSRVLEELASHPRVASMDSQAWGLAMRREHPTGRSNVLAVEFMAKFYRAQRAHVRRGGKGFPPSSSLPLRPPSPWRGRTEAYRRAAAEVLHAIRNGDMQAIDYGISMQMFELQAEPA